MSKAQALYDIDNMDCPSEEGQIRDRDESQAPAFEWPIAAQLPGIL